MIFPRGAYIGPGITEKKIEEEAHFFKE